MERKTDIRYVEAERLPPSSAWLRRPIEFNNSICMAAVSALHNTPVRSHYHSHYTDQETEAASSYMCGSSQPSHLQGTEQKLILGSVKDCTTMPHRFPALCGVVWMYLTLSYVNKSICYSEIKLRVANKLNVIIMRWLGCHASIYPTRFVQ